MTLQKGIIKYEFHPSPWNYFWRYFFGIGVFSWIPEIIRRSHTYTLSDKGLDYKYKLFSKKEVFISYSKIQNTHLKQGLLQRMFNIGDLYIDTSGSNKIELIMKGIKNPSEIKRILSQAKE